MNNVRGYWLGESFEVLMIGCGLIGRAAVRELVGIGRAEVRVLVGEEASAGLATSLLECCGCCVSRVTNSIR